jgi:hypothetical protein
VLILVDLVLGSVGEDGLEGGRGDRLWGRARIVEREFGAGGGGDRSSFDRGEGDEGEVELLDASVRGDSQVGPQASSWGGRLDDDLEGGAGLEGVSDLPLDGVVTGGSDWKEPFAELRVTNIVVEEAL